MAKKESKTKRQSNKTVTFIIVYCILFVFGLTGCLLPEIEIILGNNLALIWAIFGILFAIVSFIHVQNLKTLKELNKFKGVDNTIDQYITENKQYIKISSIMVIASICMAFLFISGFTINLMLHTTMVWLDKIYIAVILASFISSVYTIVDMLMKLGTINYIIMDYE